MELVKGLFSDSIPTFLKEQQRYAGGNKTISYLHIDCDLYAGTRDAFQLLDQYIVPGTVILFDDLVSSLAASRSAALDGVLLLVQKLSQGP